MNYYPFNSREKLYKPHFGAIKAGETLLLRVLLHFDAHVHDCFLVIKEDSGNFYEVKMEPKEWLEGYRFYDTEITLNEGLYFYKFRYTSDYGEFFVTKTGGSLGIVSNDGELWQQTVYAKDFSTPDYIKGGIIYQIFPDRFYSSGTKKKNVFEDRFLCESWEKQPEYRQNNGKCSLGNDYYGGDLLGIEEKLPYLKDLGVSVIYLNPIFEAHSNHRYNTADYLKIDPLLGDENDLKNLCKSAKKLGISIIFDGVFSHTGDDSIYFNRYKRYGDGGAYNDMSSPYRKWYSFGNFDCGYAAWWGVPSLPEVREETPEFSEFITGDNGVISKWLKLGLAGVRLDVADELPDVILNKIRTCAKKVNKDSFILGEVWEDASNKISYSKRRKFLQGNQLDSVMNYPFANGIIDYVCTKNAEKLAETVMTILENYPKESIHLLMNHIGTHDTARVITAIARYNCFCGDRAWQSGAHLSNDEYNFAVLRLKIAAVIQYCLPGVPSLYYGDEAGLTGYGDPFCRGTYPWGKENTDLLCFYKALGTLRRKHKCFVDGEYVPICAKDGAFGFLRIKDNDVLQICANATENNADINNVYRLKNVLFGENISENDEKITLKPYGYCILG
ncbi:MAG: glycoside hydrolase family 13 protein [Clostridia bacterium]|nr:glycoside hydrolase family 13 protein [Clostridia bacterium]